MRIFICLAIGAASLMAQDRAIQVRGGAGYGTTRWLTKTSFAEFEGGGISVPMDISVTCRIKRFHFGLGYGYEHLSISGTVNRSNPGSPSLAFHDGRVLFNKFSLIGGYTLNDHVHPSVTPFLEIGFFDLDDHFSDDVVAHEYFGAVSLDLSMPLWDRVDVFFRPEAELKHYDPSGQTSVDIDHWILTFAGRVGVQYRFPF